MPLTSDELRAAVREVMPVASGRTSRTWSGSSR